MLQLTNGLSIANGYGNGFVFQLPNGHFIIIDGGKRGDAKNLSSYLKALVGTDENGNQKDVYIDAWIITHFHSDHCGVLHGLYQDASLREGIYVEALFASEPNNYSKLIEAASSDVIGTATRAIRGLMSFTKSPVASGEVPRKPDVFSLHMGERHYFNGVTMDVVMTQEQLSVADYGKYNDPDKFNATSTNCVFTINETGDKIYMGGDSTKVNMNYIMKTYDGINSWVKRVKEEVSGEYTRWTDSEVTNVAKTESKVLSDISVFVAFHHGKNTVDAFTRYLFGEIDTMDDELELVLFPYHQMYRAEFRERYILSGVEYKNRYWLEDESTVFNYLIEDVNKNLCANANNVFYTYGCEDVVSGVSMDYQHGTVELTFTEAGINSNIVKSWVNGFSMETFE